MKTTSKLVAVLCFLLFSTPGFSQLKVGKVKVNEGSVSGIGKAAKAFTLSSEEVINLSIQFVQWMDGNNPVASYDNPYTIRLNKIVKDHLNEDGLNLNFKVYELPDVNAFACADGSVRVFAGLMDLMTDGEILGVIGHEIGHVKNIDTKDAIKTAFLASAARDAASSQGGKMAALSNSELGGFAEALIKAQFSKGQETAADTYGFNFLKRNNYNVEVMGSALRKLEKLEANSVAGNSKSKQLFSSHPDTGKRAERMEKKAKE